MQSLYISTAVFLATFVFSAGNATALDFPAPIPPDVFDGGDIGVMLAMDMAGETDAYPTLENIAENFSPWSGGFGFPAAASVPTSVGELPGDLPGVVYENVGLSGDFPDDLSGGTAGESAGSTFSIVPVPEPEPALLLALGLVVIGSMRRREAA